MNYIKLTNFDDELTNQIVSYIILQQELEKKEENNNELLLQLSEAQIFRK